MKKYLFLTVIVLCYCSSNIKADCVDFFEVDIAENDVFQPTFDICYTCTCKNNKSVNCNYKYCPPVECTNYTLGRHCCEVYCDEEQDIPEDLRELPYQSKNNVQIDSDYDIDALPEDLRVIPVEEEPSTTIDPWSKNITHSFFNLRNVTEM